MKSTKIKNTSTDNEKKIEVSSLSLLFFTNVQTPPEEREQVWMNSIDTTMTSKMGRIHLLFFDLFFLSINIPINLTRPSAQVETLNDVYSVFCFTYDTTQTSNRLWHSNNTGKATIPTIIHVSHIASCSKRFADSPTFSRCMASTKATVCQFTCRWSWNFRLLCLHVLGLERFTRLL